VLEGALHGGRANADGDAPLDFGFPAVVVSQANEAWPAVPPARWSNPFAAIHRGWDVATPRAVPARADPLPWLLGIARRVLANRRRGERRLVALRDRLVTVTPSAPVDEPSGYGLDPGVEVALRSLSERDREILLLVAWDRLEPARAARVLGTGRERSRCGFIELAGAWPACATAMIVKNAAGQTVGVTS
jgi:hypothetical protein